MVDLLFQSFLLFNKIIFLFFPVRVSIRLLCAHLLQKIEATGKFIVAHGRHCVEKKLLRIHLGKVLNRSTCIN